MFDFSFSELHECPLNPEYFIQHKKTSPYYMKILKAFSPSFLDDFMNAHTDLLKLELDSAYRDGFQDGVLFLTRSLLSLPGFPKTPWP